MDPPKCKVILTSDRTLMSNYGNSLFYGFISTAPRASFLTEFIFKAVFNKVPLDEYGRASLAPQGLRRIESALVMSGLLRREEVVVTVPEKIHKFLNEETKVIGISTFDPLGKGPASTTISGPFGIVHEDPFNAYYFRKLVGSEEVRKARRLGVTVVVGGPGAWQLGYEEMERMGILSKRAHSGYSIMKEVRRITGINYQAGIIYPLLYSLENEGLIIGRWRPSGRRNIKDYSLTPEGASAFKMIRKFLSSSLREMHDLIE